MAAMSGVSITTPKTSAKISDSSKPHQPTNLFLPNSPWKKNSSHSQRLMYLRPAAAAPDQLSGKVEESIKSAQEACSEDPVSGECKAAWDEVEELSAAASHARDKKKLESDPLENYCQDNPETDECRTYDN